VHLAFASSRAEAAMGTLLLALATLVAGLALASRKLRSARRMAESSREARLALSGDGDYRREPERRATIAEDAVAERTLAEGARRAIAMLQMALVAVAGLVALYLMLAGGVMVREWVRVMF
jgi:hypothetical protein